MKLDGRGHYRRVLDAAGGVRFRGGYNRASARPDTPQAYTLPTTREQLRRARTVCSNQWRHTVVQWLHPERGSCRRCGPADLVYGGNGCFPLPPNPGTPTFPSGFVPFRGVPHQTIRALAAAGVIGSSIPCAA